MSNVIWHTDFKHSNPKSDRAFWIGKQPDPLETMAIEIMNEVMPADTTPCEYGPDKEPA